MRDPLLAPLAAIAGGILVSRFVPFQVRELLAVITALTILGILGLWRQNRALAGVACLLALLFAGALADVLHRPGPPPQLDADGPVILSGCVVEPPVLAGDRERFVLELDPGARAQVTLYTRDGEQPPHLDYGRRIELDAKVRSPHNYGNPGAFDYTQFLARRDIFWTASASADAVRFLPGSCGSRFTAAIMNLRAAAMTRIEQLYPADAYNTGMMQAIMLGATFQLQRVWTESFRNTGTYHVIVISGLHVAVLASFLLLLFRVAFLPEGLANWLALVMTWLYVLITGWQAPGIRSAAGFTLYLAGRYFFRERRALNLLAAIAIAFLVLDPEQLFEPSFQLSFLAIAFIGAFARPLVEATTLPLARALPGLDDSARDLHLPPRTAQFRVELRLLAQTLRLYTRLPERAGLRLLALPLRVFFYVYELAALSAVMQIGLALPMIVYFHRFGFSGISANTFAVPLFTLLLPLGFLAILSGWGWVGKLCGGLLAASRAAVSWHAALEPNWRIPSPPLWLAIALSAALLAAAILRGRWKALAGAAVAAFVALLLWHPFPPQIARSQLELSAIDVGQGDSLLVAFPDGKLMVVDGGGIPAFGHSRRTQLDIGEDVVSPYLWDRSIRTIDVLALTHAHEDHIGGLAALIDNFHVKELWTGAEAGSPAWCALRDKALRRGVRIVAMQGGARLDFGGARVEVLAPLAGYVATEVPRNDDSLVLRLCFGKNSFLLTGDVERPVERELVRGGVIAHADVLKVAHHGSKTSTTADLLDLAQPEFAIISVGAGNTYGHPNPAVLDRLAGHRTSVFRTDRDGLVSIRSDGRRLSVDLGRWRPPGPASLYSAF